MDHSLAFDATWFKRHQPALLWLLNAPATKWWARRAVGVSRYVPYQKRIDGIGPNHVATGMLLGKDREVQVTSKFLVKREFAQNVYRSFKLLWWAMHAWDTAFADRFAPALSCGFYTLTFHWPSGAGGADETAARDSVDETFATIKAGAGTSTYGAGTTTFIRLYASGTTNQFAGLYRQFITFDTSAIGAGSTVTAASLTYYYINGLTQLGSPGWYIFGATPASNTDIVAADYSQYQNTLFASLAFPTSVGYYTLTFNASGIAAVSKSGYSKFCSRLSWDYNGTGWTWASYNYSDISFSSIGYPNTYHPTMDVTYISPPGNFLIMF